jgi:hypothetical protein
MTKCHHIYNRTFTAEQHFGQTMKKGLKYNQKFSNSGASTKFCFSVSSVTEATIVKVFVFA